MQLMALKLISIQLNQIQQFTRSQNYILHSTARIISTKVNKLYRNFATSWHRYPCSFNLLQSIFFTITETDMKRTNNPLCQQIHVPAYKWASIYDTFSSVWHHDPVWPFPHCWIHDEECECCITSENMNINLARSLRLNYKPSRRPLAKTLPTYNNQRQNCMFHN
jgi:hypothetical protein